jgi:hypothetical protein
MAWDIRKSYEDGINEAFDWYLRAPGFLKAMWMPYISEDRDQFVKSLNSGLSFSLYDGYQHKVLAHTEDRGGGAAEGHMFCAPDADEDQIVATLRYAKKETLKSFQQIICCIHRKHLMLHKVLPMCGFVDTGYRSWRGVYRGAPIEILYYLSRR